jgi:O-antigen/teichoic acid export membrane protein
MIGLAKLQAAAAGVPPVQVFAPLPFGLERARRVPSVVLAMFDQALVSGTNFLLVVALARCVAVEEFGLFTLSFSVLLFFSSLIYAVVVLPISVFLPERRGGEVNAYLARLERVHRAMIPVLIVLAVPVLLLLGSWQLVMATALATAMRMGVEYHRRVAYALHDSLRALLVDAGSYATLAVIATIALVYPVPCQAWHAMLVLAGCGLAGWLAGLWANRDAITAPSVEPMGPVVRRHWDFGKWNLGGTIAMWGASQMYPFMVAGMLGLRDVALLNGSIRIMGVSNVLVQGIEAFAMPRLRAQMVGSNISAFRQSLFSVFIAGTGIMLPLCALGMIAPERVMAVCLGEHFTHGAFALRIIALTQFLSFVARIVSIGLNSLKEPKPGFWAQAVCAIATLLAGPWIVSVAGLQGACLALLCNATIILLISAGSFFRIMRRHRSGSGLPDFRPDVRSPSDVG